MAMIRSLSLATIVSLVCLSAQARPEVAVSSNAWSNVVRAAVGRLLCSSAFCGNTYSNLFERYPYDGRDRVQGYKSYLRLLEDLEKASHSYALTNSLDFYNTADPIPETNTLEFIRLPEDAFDIMTNQGIIIGSPRHLLQDFDGVAATRYVKKPKKVRHGEVTYGDPFFVSLIEIDTAHTHLIGGMEHALVTNESGTQTVASAFGRYVPWFYDGETAISAAQGTSGETGISAQDVFLIESTGTNITVGEDGRAYLPSVVVYGPDDAADWLPYVLQSNDVVNDYEYAVDAMTNFRVQIDEARANEWLLDYFANPGESGKGAYFLSGPTNEPFNVVISNCVPYFRAGLDDYEDMPVRVLTTNDLAQISNIVKQLKYSVPDVWVGADACFFPWAYIDDTRQNSYTTNTITTWPVIDRYSSPGTIMDGTLPVNVSQFYGQSYPHVYTYTNSRDTVFKIPGSGVPHDEVVTIVSDDGRGTRVYETQTVFRAIFFNAHFNLYALDTEASMPTYKCFTLRVNGNCCGNWDAYPYAMNTSFPHNVECAFDESPVYKGKWRMWSNTNETQNNFIDGETLAEGSITFALTNDFDAPERAIANVSNLFWERCTSMVSSNIPTNAWSTNAGHGSASGLSSLYLDIGSDRMNVGFQLISIVTLPDPW